MRLKSVQLSINTEQEFVGITTPSTPMLQVEVPDPLKNPYTPP